MNMILSQHYNLDKHTVKKMGFHYSCTFHMYISVLRIFVLYLWRSNHLLLTVKYQRGQRTDNYIIFLLNIKYNRLRIKEILPQDKHNIYAEFLKYKVCVFGPKKKTPWKRPVNLWFVTVRNFIHIMFIF